MKYRRPKKFYSLLKPRNDCYWVVFLEQENFERWVYQNAGPFWSGTQKKKNSFIQFLEYLLFFKYSTVFWQLFFGEEKIQPSGLNLA